MDDQKVEAFNAVTGNQSKEAAEFFIEASGGSVEEAINAYLESGGAVPDAADSGNGAPAPATSTPADKPKVTVASAKDDEEQRWYTGGPQGGSGQEVIAPGQGGTGNMATDLMEQMKPHAHDPSEDERLAKSGAFKGSARTLDGQVKKAEEAPKVVEIKMYSDEVFTVDDGPPRDMHENAAFFEAIRRQELPPELQPEGGGTVQLSLHHVPREYDATMDAPKRTFQGASRRLNEGASTSAPAQVQQPIASWNGPDESKPVTCIQIRMPDGSRLVGRFNLDQKVHEIRSFVAAARPADKNRAYQMLSGFPQKPVPDENVTIEEAGLKGSVVVFK